RAPIHDFREHEATGHLERPAVSPLLEVVYRIRRPPLQHTYGGLEMKRRSRYELRRRGWRVDPVRARLIEPKRFGSQVIETREARSRWASRRRGKSRSRRPRPAWPRRETPSNTRARGRG